MPWNLVSATATVVFGLIAIVAALVLFGRLVAAAVEHAVPPLGTVTSVGDEEPSIGTR